MISLQFSSVAQSCLILCDPTDCSMPGSLVYQLSEFTQTQSHPVGDAIQPSHPLWSPSLPAFNLSQYRGLFQWVGSCIRWPKHWSFSLSISPSNEHPGLITFRMDCAGSRSSAHSKGYEEGGSAYAKAGSSLRSPPGNSRASTPKTRVCLLSALCSHLSPTTSLWKKS